MPKDNHLYFADDTKLKRPDNFAVHMGGEKGRAGPDITGQYFPEQTQFLLLWFVLNANQRLKYK